MFPKLECIGNMLENMEAFGNICLFFSFKYEKLMIKHVELAIWIQTFAHPKTHGLRIPNEAFFHWNSKLLGLVRQIGQINFGAFGVFLAELSLSLVHVFPCLCFPLFNHYFFKKLSLYINNPNIYLGLGFEFGPQRIHVSVVRASTHL